MIRITVDRDVCFGSGECVLAAPQVFELDAQGLSRIREDAQPIDLATAERIAANCPSGAISVEASVTAIEGEEDE